MPDARVRSARADSRDERFLWRMLVEAAVWRPGQRKLSVSDAKGDRSLARYVAGWGREGDRGVIAEVAGAAVGAAWWRFFNEDDRGYGFIEPALPEVSSAVVEGMRGQGIGTALLLGALIDEAQGEGVRALSLSAEVDNPALRLYVRLGFTRVACVGDAWTMRRDICAA